MCEARGVEEENDLKEGRRNDRTEKEGVKAIALSRYFERAVDSMVAASRLRVGWELGDNFGDSH